jgi:hypothetical protein
MPYCISFKTNTRDAFSLAGEFLGGAALLVMFYSLALCAAGYMWSKMGVIRLLRPDAMSNKHYAPRAD